MEFFVKRNDEVPEFSLADFMLECDERMNRGTMGERVDALSPDVLMRADPDYYGPRLAAIAEERKHDDGNMKGAGFRKIASFMNVPLIEALRIRDGLLRGKKEFYELLKKKYPEYRTYDNRGADHPTETFVNGRPIL